MFYILCSISFSVFGGEKAGCRTLDSVNVFGSDGAKELGRKSLRMGG